MKTLKIFFLTTYSFFFLESAIWSQNNGSMTIGQAFSTALRQKMLTQRMAKARICKSAGIKTDLVQAELEASVVSFDENLRLLTAFAPSPKVKLKLDKLQALWNEFRPALQNDSTQTGTIFVMGFNSRLLAVCDETATELLEHAKTLAPDEQQGFAPAPLAAPIFIAERARTLAQRLPLYYTAHHAQLDPNAIRQLKNIAETLNKNLDALAVQEANTTEIADALVETQKDWKSIKAKFATNGDFDFAEMKMTPEELLTLTQRMFKNLDKITVLYTILTK